MGEIPDGHGEQKFFVQFSNFTKFSTEYVLVLSLYNAYILPCPQQIHELETTLQGFINSSFENITSTDNALNLLKMFQSILQRDSLKGENEPC